MPAPMAPLTKLHDLPRFDEHGPFTCPAFNPQHVAMAMVVADGIEALAAHGLRRTVHMRVERAVISAASAKTAGGSRMNMTCLRFERPSMFTNCSM